MGMGMGMGIGTFLSFFEVLDTSIYLILILGNYTVDMSTVIGMTDFEQTQGRKQR